jgi:hypothetical protein
MVDIQNGWSDMSQSKEAKVRASATSGSTDDENARSTACGASAF